MHIAVSSCHLPLILLSFPKIENICLTRNGNLQLLLDKLYYKFIDLSKDLYDCLCLSLQYLSVWKHMWCMRCNKPPSKQTFCRERGNFWFSETLLLSRLCFVDDGTKLTQCIRIVSSSWHYLLYLRRRYMTLLCVFDSEELQQYISICEVWLYESKCGDFIAETVQFFRSYSVVLVILQKFSSICEVWLYLSIMWSFRSW